MKRKKLTWTGGYANQAPAFFTHHYEDVCCVSQTKCILSASHQILEIPFFFQNLKFFLAVSFKRRK